MFKNLDKAQEEGVSIYQTSMVIDGVVDTNSYEGLTIGGYNLHNLADEFVVCYGKKVKVEITVTVNL